jgi:hypothetical protein
MLRQEPLTKINGGIKEGAMTGKDRNQPLARASPKDQVQQFRKAARELGCDESEERFQEALRTIGKQKPKKAGDTPLRKSRTQTQD